MLMNLYALIHGKTFIQISNEPFRKKKQMLNQNCIKVCIIFCTCSGKKKTTVSSMRCF